MREFANTEGWDSMRDDVVFTIAMLRASGVHAPLATPAEEHVTKWDVVDVDRRGADAAVVQANALVAWRNMVLDRHTSRFAVQLLADCDGDRTQSTYTAFFKVAPSEITRQALESQLDAMKGFATLAATEKLKKSTRATLQEVLDTMELGKAAIAARVKAAAGVTTVSRKQDAWREEANLVRRGVETALDDHANKNKLPRGYADGFFSAAKAAKKPAAPTVAAQPAATQRAAGLSETDQVLALPDRLLRALSEEFIATLPASVQAIVRARRAG